MALRRPAWQKFVRVGAFLLVFVLFVPVLVIFLMKTTQLITARKAMYPSVVMTGEARDFNPMMAVDEMPTKMWRTDSDMTPSMMTLPSSGVGEEGALAVDEVMARKLTQTATLDLRAQSLDWTTGKIREVVKNIGGYIENMNVSEPETGLRTAWMSVRVPSDRLETAVDEIKKSANSVTQENVGANDVTEYSIDLTARLNSKRAEEAALVSLLNRAEKVSDVIEVTSRLSVVRGEIERMESEERLLNSQVEMSSIGISITEDPRIVADTNNLRDGNVLKRSVSELYRFAIGFGSAFLALVISGLPIVLVYSLILWGSYRLGRFVAHRLIHRK